MKNFIVFRLVAALGLLTFVSSAVNAPGWGASDCRADENWNQYRGPRGDGSALSTKLPTQWSETQSVRWKVPLEGKAWSSPVVWKSQIWLTNATADGRQLSVIALDRETGKIEKNITVFTIEKPQFCIEKNSYASSTPVIEEGRLYAHYGVHGTACLDTATGKTLWSRQDLPCNHHRGAASSPILHDQLLILTFDGFDVQYLVALDKRTGETVWKTDRAIKYDSDNGDIKKAYATPTIITVAGSPQLVAPSAGASMAYDPATGKEIWRVRCGGMNVAARPLFGNGLVYMTTADGGFKMFATKPEGSGDVTETHVAWKQGKGIPKYSSQILLDGLLYMGSEGGVLTCIDAATGDVVWQERVGGVFTASPLVAGGRVYFFSEDGNTTVIKAGRTFEAIATNKLSDGCMASPAVTGDALLIRTTKGLYRIETSN